MRIKGMGKRPKRSRVYPKKDIDLDSLELFCRWEASVTERSFLVSGPENRIIQDLKGIFDYHRRREVKKFHSARRNPSTHRKLW